MDNAPYEDIARHLSFGVEHVDGREERKTIYPVAEAELGSYRSLGRGSAEFPGHVLHMAFKHVPDFFERVVGYRLTAAPETVVMEEALAKPFRSIEFFERA
jgi:hypothetical protein